MIDFTCEERASNSPFIHSIWRNRGGAVETPFISMAATYSSIVVTHYRGKTMMTVRGPESVATPAFGPADAEFVGILFKPGTFLPLISPQQVMDRCDVHLPSATGKNFWLHGDSWEAFNFDNAESFVGRLAREQVLVHDSIVSDALTARLHDGDLSLRSVQRRFVRATGLTYGTFTQIERARRAVSLLRGGMSILDAVYECGYFDQPHMTRAFKRFIGITPAQIVDPTRSTPLSFLYKTNPS